MKINHSSAFLGFLLCVAFGFTSLNTEAQWFKKKNTNNFRKQPYLIFSNHPDEMDILWQLNVTDVCRIAWGETDAYEIDSKMISEIGPDHRHHFVFKQLKPSTLYKYRVIYKQDTVFGKFYSSPAPGSKDLTFFAYGDTRTHPGAHDAVASQILAELQNDNNAHTFVVSSGDFVSNGNKESDWDNQFFDAQYMGIRKMMQELPYLGAVGNHEGNGQLFAKYFPYPFYNQGKYYWSFDYGPAHFAIVDQFVNVAAGSAQYNWLENDLASTNKKWKFILLHKPGWSAGGGHSNNKDVQDFIQPLAKKYGVQMIIAGHNHYYALADVDGVLHLTTGGGGAPLYNPDESMPNISIVSKSLHFCKMQIIDNELYVYVIDDKGSLIDDFRYSDFVSGVEENHVFKEISVFPNPFDSTANIEFSLSEKSYCLISVYGVAGNLIRNLKSQEFLPGKHIVSWNGLDESGKKVPTGVYYLRLENAGNENFAIKIIRMQRQ